MSLFLLARRPTRAAGMAALGTVSNALNQQSRSVVSRRALSAAAATSQPPSRGGGGGGQQPQPGAGKPSFSAPRPPPASPAPHPPTAAGGSSASHNAGKVIFNVGGSDFKQIVLDSPVPVILDCWAEWCG